MKTKYVICKNRFKNCKRKGKTAETEYIYLINNGVTGDDRIILDGKESEKNFENSKVKV